jgi:hypothetical protein
MAPAGASGEPLMEFTVRLVAIAGPDSTEALRVAKEYTGVRTTPRGFVRYLGPSESGV